MARVRVLPDPRSAAIDCRGRRIYSGTLIPVHWQFTGGSHFPDLPGNSHHPGI
jgi:hypothetical protein